MFRRGTIVLATATLAACGGGRSESAQQTLTFHSRPDLTPPVVTVLRRTAAAAPGYVFIAPKKEAIQKGPEIVDGTGQPVWFDPVPAQATDFRVQTYHGRPVLTWWQGPVEAPVRGSGVGHGVVMDASYRVVARVESSYGANTLDLHEFRLTPRGTVLATVYRIVPADLTGVGGPRHARLVDSVVQEIDVRTGRVLFTWHSIGHVAPSESYSDPPPADGHGPDEPFDYFHVNSIDEEADGNLLVSGRNTHAVYEIDRRTGAILWRLGGKRSSFTMGPGTRFAWQHDARRLPDGTISIFDNEAAPQIGKESRAIRIRLNPGARTASLVNAKVSPAHVLAGSQGDVQRLAGGSTFVGWGAVPRFTEFGPAGTVTLDATLPDGDDSYRAYKFRWKGHPVSQPAIAVSKDSNRVTVYASWNGATALERWQLLGGANADHLAPIGPPQVKRGFETAMSAKAAAAYYAVRALDAGGRTLGESAAVQPGGLAIG